MVEITVQESTPPVCILAKNMQRQLHPLYDVFVAEMHAFEVDKRTRTGSEQQLLGEVGAVHQALLPLPVVCPNLSALSSLALLESLLYNNAQLLFLSLCVHMVPVYYCGEGMKRCFYSPYAACVLLFRVEGVHPHPLSHMVSCAENIKYTPLPRPY